MTLDPVSLSYFVIFGPIIGIHCSLCFAPQSYNWSLVKHLNWKILQKLLTTFKETNLFTKIFQFINQFIKIFLLNTLCTQVQKIYSK